MRVSNDQVLMAYDIEDMAGGHVAAKAIEETVFNFLQGCMRYGSMNHLFQSLFDIFNY